MNPICQRSGRRFVRTVLTGVVAFMFAKCMMILVTALIPTGEPSSPQHVATLGPTAMAQEADAPVEEAAADAPVAEEAVAEEPAAPEEPAAKHATKSYFTWFIESSGLIGLFILVLSVLFVARVCQLFVEYRIEVAVPRTMLDRLYNHLAQNEFREIYQTVQGDSSVLARLLTTGITELQSGKEQARETMERFAESIQVDMEKRITLLSTLGTLGPMIGLLGTLKGMIGAFSVIARSDTQMKASEVAGAISEALLLTFEGVALSVPAIWFFALFRNRILTIMATASYEADKFLRQFADQVQQQKGV